MSDGKTDENIHKSLVELRDIVHDAFWDDGKVKGDVLNALRRANIALKGKGGRFGESQKIYAARSDKNTKAVCEALETIRESMEGKLFRRCPTYLDDEAIYTLACEALGKPRRECDVGTPEEQECRFERFCNKFSHDYCKGCPLPNAFWEKDEIGECRLEWAQRPYEESNYAVEDVVQLEQDGLKLKPCPECGKELGIFHNPFRCGGGFFIEHSTPNKDCSFISYGPYRSTKNRAIAAWNRHADYRK